MSPTPSEGAPADGAGAEVGLLEMAAHLLLQELDQRAAQALRTHGVVQLLERLAPGAEARVEALAEDAEAREELAAEYCRLFLMSRQTSPIASVWSGADSQKAGEHWTSRVVRWEAALGHEVAGGAWGNLPKDHIAGLLALRALALRQGAVDIADEIAAGLRPWIVSFRDGVQRSSDEPVYRAVAALVAELVAPSD